MYPPDRKMYRTIIIIIQTQSYRIIPRIILFPGYYFRTFMIRGEGMLNIINSEVVNCPLHLVSNVYHDLYYNWVETFSIYQTLHSFRIHKFHFVSHSSRYRE